MTPPFEPPRRPGPPDREQDGDDLNEDEEEFGDEDEFEPEDGEEEGVEPPADELDEEADEEEAESAAEEEEYEGPEEEEVPPYPTILVPPPGRRPLPATPPPYFTASEQSFLRSPYVIAGLAVAGAIVLAIFVVFIFGTRGGNGGDGGLIVEPLTPQPGRGVIARSIAIATVLEGPDRAYPALGELRAGLDIEVVGRTQDSTWYQIYYPPGSQLRGWVPSTALRVPAEGAAIPIASVTPLPRPTVPQPTAAPEPTATETPTPTETGTPTPVGGPDLAVSIAPQNCAPGITLVVTVRNAGTTPVDNRSIRLTVLTSAGVQRVIDTSVSLPPGATVNLPTGFTVSTRTTVNLDLLGSPNDINLANNQADCAVGTPPVPGTPTPSPVVPPPIGTASPTATP